MQQKEDTPTQQQSLTLMRNLLRTSISSIAYLRGLFPEGATPTNTLYLVTYICPTDSFKDRNLAGRVYSLPSLLISLM